MWTGKLLKNSQIKRAIREKSTEKAYNYKYWQQSKIPTFHFQKSLPRLPVPKLEDTCRRYLAAQSPLLSEEAYKKTERLVKEFQHGVGQTLHQELLAEDKKNKHTSYISSRWFDMYLKDRTPLPINYNPVLVWQQDPKIDYNVQEIRATNMIISAMRFYQSLQDHILEPEVFHLNPKKSDTDSFRRRCSITPAIASWYMAYLHNAYPLDMSQYTNLFNSTRIPEIGKDRIGSAPGRHIVVQCGGDFYVMDVLNENGDILEAEKIYGGIKQVLEMAKQQKLQNKEGCNLGVFTTMQRDEWAKLRGHLMALDNEDSLNLIDSALFSVCLDDVVLGEDKYKLVRTFLHSDGKNRWFDKSLSMQFTTDGYGGINFEHSWGDGVAVLRIFQDMLKDSTENPQIHPGTTSKNIPVTKIDFKLDNHIKESIDQATKDYKAVCDSLDVNFIESEGLDKKFCKKHSVSPDGIMQLCFQSAYYKQYGKFVGTYESCSTAAFKHGRTETIRPLTNATKEYILAQHSSNKPSQAELGALIKKCSTVHSQLTKEAAMGQGFDRHLYVLKSLATARGGSLPDLFADESYAKMNHNILSTSTLSSPAVLAGGFGPVVRDGYGVGYVIRDHAMGTLATSYPGMNGREYIDCLDRSIKEAVAALIASSK